MLEAEAYEPYNTSSSEDPLSALDPDLVSLLSSTLGEQSNERNNDDKFNINSTAVESEGQQQQQNNSQQAQKAIPTSAVSSSSSSQKQDTLMKLGILPMVCKPCNPASGLRLGDRPITLQELATLEPDDLEEHILMLGDEPVSTEKLIELLESSDNENNDTFKFSRNRK